MEQMNTKETGPPTQQKQEQQDISITTGWQTYFLHHIWDGNIYILGYKPHSCSHEKVTDYDPRLSSSKNEYLYVCMCLC